MKFTIKTKRVETHIDMYEVEAPSCELAQIIAERMSRDETREVGTVHITSWEASGTGPVTTSEMAKGLKDLLVEVDQHASGDCQGLRDACAHARELIKRQWEET